MEHHEPSDAGEGRESAQRGAPAEDALRRLERRLDEASEAAERVISEAAQAAASRQSDVPPAGWQIPGPDDPSIADRAEADPLLHLIRALRDLIPPELQRRLAEALREVLLAIRALIDWYLERMERRRAEPAEVQDIPIL
jgi:hypothetical protein